MRHDSLHGKRVFQHNEGIGIEHIAPIARHRRWTSKVFARDIIEDQIDICRPLRFKT